MNDKVEINRSLVEDMISTLDYEGRTSWTEELRALLNVPTIKRQGPVAWRGVNSLGEIVTEWIDGSPPEKLYDLCGNESMYDKVDLAYLHPSSAKEGWREDECGNLKYWPEEVAALQSTIAQLQARAQELESGRGEPSFYAQMGKSEYPEEWRGVIKKHLDRLNGYTVPLFTTPPVPVAVVLPDFDTWYTKNIGVVGTADHKRARKVWNACLDATAALNGERK